MLPKMKLAPIRVYSDVYSSLLRIALFSPLETWIPTIYQFSKSIPTRGTHDGFLATRISNFVAVRFCFAEAQYVLLAASDACVAELQEFEDRLVGKKLLTPEFLYKIFDWAAHRRRFLFRRHFSRLLSIPEEQLLPILKGVCTEAFMSVRRSPRLTAART